MRNKKTLFAILLILFLVIGVTIAYFQSSASFENIFNTGTYKVVTTEVFESPTNWAPGEEIPKTITTKNEGTIPAAVRVSYTEQWLDGDTDISDLIPEGAVTVNLDNTSDWTKVGNFYYYNYILNPNETTSSFIKSVTLNAQLGSGDDMECTPTADGKSVTCEASDPLYGAKYLLTITKETVQADKYKDLWNTNVSITEKPNSSITYLSRQVEGQITPGDIIGIGETEDFYVISSNAEKTVLLAKYNLLVGEYVDENHQIGMLTPENTPGYGLQSIDAVGYTEFNKGTIAFSNDIYWMDEETLISPYNENDTIYYDTNIGMMKYRDSSISGEAHPYVYNSNSLVYPYISGENGYVNRLKSMGAPSSITGRLLSYEEAITTNPDILTVDSWYGSVEDYTYVYLWNPVSASAEYYNDSFCIRPVIEIPTSEIG